MRHNLTFTHFWELPFGRGRALLGDAPDMVQALIGGWSLNGSAVPRSEEPINTVRGVDFNDDGDATADRPALLNGGLNDLYRMPRLVRHKSGRVMAFLLAAAMIAKPKDHIF